MSKIITDNDIFSKSNIDFSNTKSWEIRNAVRIIVLDNDKKIALSGIKYSLFPGGGIEEGESIEKAAIREAKEEIGCDVEIVKQLGSIVELKAKINRKQNTTFVLAKIIGRKGLPTTTQVNEQGIKIKWLRIEETEEILQNQTKTIPNESYHSRFNLKTNIIFLDILKKSLDFYEK